MSFKRQKAEESDEDINAFFLFFAVFDVVVVQSIWTKHMTVPSIRIIYLDGCIELDYKSKLKINSA